MKGVLSRRLRAARVSAGFTDLESFASLICMKARRLRALEEGRKAPTLDELHYIGKVTNKALEFFVGGAMPWAAASLTLLAFTKSLFAHITSLT